MQAARLALVGGVALAAIGGAQARAGETPFDAAPAIAEVTRVQIDGAAYCQDYAGRVEALGQQRPAHAAEVVELIREGKAQCAAGQIKNGLHRLRMAWAMLIGE